MHVVSVGDVDFAVRPELDVVSSMPDSAAGAEQFGDVIETSPGQYQITAPVVPGNPRRFYRVRSP